MAMPTLLGKFGVRGGGYTMSNGGAVSEKSSIMPEALKGLPLGPSPASQAGTLVRWCRVRDLQTPLITL